MVNTEEVVAGIIVHAIGVVFGLVLSMDSGRHPEREQWCKHYHEKVGDYEACLTNPDRRKG